MSEETIEEQMAKVLQRVEELRSSAHRISDDKFKERLPKWIMDAELIISNIRNEANEIADERTRVRNLLAERDDMWNEQKVEKMKLELAEMDACMKNLRPLTDVGVALEAVETYENQRKRNYNQRADLVLALEDTMRALQVTNASVEENWKQSAAENTDREMFQLKGAMLKTLRDEVIIRKERLIYDLYEEWGETFRWDIDKDNTNRLCLNIGVQFPDVVVGLKSMQLLEKKLDHLGKCLLNYLLIPLLSEQGSKVNILSADNGQAEITLMKQCNEEEGSRSTAAIMEECLSIFQVLQHSLSTDEAFVQALLEGYVLKPLKELIVDFILKPAVPSDSIDDPKFNELLAACDNFLQQMHASGLITEEHSSFENFAANIDSMFLAKRCQTILHKARKLITADMHNTVQVGGETRNAEEHQVDTRTRPEAEKPLPPVSEFPRCRVSETVVSLLELIIKTLNEAANSDKPLVAARLYHCSRNMVELYLDLVAVRREHELKTVPQLTAIFYNNCYFLCHHISTFGSSYEAKLLPRFGTPAGIISVTFLDYVPRLKQIAAEFMDNLAVAQTQYLIDCLKPTNGFFNISNPVFSSACKKALKACSLQFQHIHRVCSQILALPVLLKLQGKLFGSLLCHIVNSVARLEDIAEKDAELIHQLFTTFLKESETCFLVDDVQYIHRYCEEGYYKYKELLFVLNASLAEIEDRWASGAGPLAHWMDALDVKQLIRALFQNTDRRAALIAKIK